MMFGIFELAGAGFFKTGATVIGLHTGGLQGLSALRELKNEELSAVAN